MPHGTSHGLHVARQNKQGRNSRGSVEIASQSRSFLDNTFLYFYLICLFTYLITILLKQRVTVTHLNFYSKLRCECAFVIARDILILCSHLNHSRYIH